MCACKVSGNGVTADIDECATHHEHVSDAAATCTNTVRASRARVEPDRSTTAVVHVRHDKPPSLCGRNPIYLGSGDLPRYHAARGRRRYDPIVDAPAPHRERFDPADGFDTVRRDLAGHLQSVLQRDLRAELPRFDLGQFRDAGHLDTDDARRSRSR